MILAAATEYFAGYPGTVGHFVIIHQVSHP